MTPEPEPDPDPDPTPDPDPQYELKSSAGTTSMQGTSYAKFDTLQYEGTNYYVYRPNVSGSMGTFLVPSSTAGSIVNTEIGMLQGSYYKYGGNGYHYDEGTWESATVGFQIADGNGNRNTYLEEVIGDNVVVTVKVGSL